MKKSNDTIGNGTATFRLVSAVPQPTAPPRAPSHCSEDLKYYFCGFLACYVVFRQDLFRGKWGFEVQRKGRGSGPGKFWNNRTVSVAILFAVPTSQTPPPEPPFIWDNYSRLRLKCDGTRAETRFRLSAKRTSPFKSTRTSVQSSTGNRGVRISGSNAGYSMFRGSVNSTGYPLHLPVSPSLPLPCVAVWHHISTGLYRLTRRCRHTRRCFMEMKAD